LHILNQKGVRVGGQAVIEGVMMRAPRAIAIAVRKANGEVVIKGDVWRSLAERFSFLKWPILRGVLVLGEALVNGIQALSFSANQAMEEEESGRATGTGSWAIFFTMVVAMALGIFLFVVLPHVISLWIAEIAPEALGIDSVYFHLIDGLLKIAFFLLYILGISQLKDIQRIFQYHGAEHKSIYAYEAGEALTVENARKYSTLHPRCGTAFILMVLIISIVIFSIVFAFIPKPVAWPFWVSNAAYIFLKIGLMLPIAGLSYELTRWTSARPDHAWVRPFVAPGLYLQRLTTREPSDDQIEVALRALNRALSLNSQYKIPSQAPS